MTPQFTTPCYVRIEDADKRKEICEQLERIGYIQNPSAVDQVYKTILTDKRLYYGVTSGYVLPDSKAVYCGTNTRLFIALASMRDDTDEGQWFVCDYGSVKELMCNNCEGNGNWIFSGDYRRASADEIIYEYNTNRELMCGNCEKNKNLNFF